MYMDNLFGSFNSKDPIYKAGFKNEGGESNINNSENKNKNEKKHSKNLKIILAILVFAVIAFNCLYSQSVGTTVVLVNFGGSVAGHSEEAGFHFKLPWQVTISYDTRNNLINMYGNADYAYDGGSAQGSSVTINDSSGAKAAIDIQVNYSLDPSTAEYLYSEYGSQTTFTQNYISQDVRSVAREQAGKFDTITLLTDRAQYTKAITEALTKKWKEIGLTVEQVTVQDIAYPESITDAYARAQEAEVEKQTKINEQESAKIEAETKVMQAEKEAEANRKLSESLTSEVLTKQYYDTLRSLGKDGNIVITDGNSTPVVNVGK